MEDALQRKELLRKMINEDYARKDALADARKIVDPILPARLFKFRGVTKWALSNFKRNTLYCALPESFNDPFDCSLTFEGPDITAKALEAFKLDNPRLVEQIKASIDPVAELVGVLGRRLGLTREEDIRKVTVVIRDLLNEPIDHLDKSLRKSRIICSLSERVDSLPMWAHYGDDHRGFAMEYSFQTLEESDELRSSVWPVLYSPQRYNVTSHIFGESVKEFNDLFVLGGALCKSSDWQYEHEWRIVKKSSSEASGENINVPAPVGIYIGADAAHVHVKALTRMAALKRIPAYKMQLSRKEFKMIPEAL